MIGKGKLGENYASVDCSIPIPRKNGPYVCFEVDDVFYDLDKNGFTPVYHVRDSHSPMLLNSGDLEIAKSILDKSGQKYIVHEIEIPFVHEIEIP